MKLGVLTVVLSGKSFMDTVKYLKGLGVQSVEVGAGGYPGKAHLNPDILLSDDGKLEEVKAILRDNDMELCAISCHGNPVHPNPKIAADFHSQFEKAVLLAEKLGVSCVVTFSGCPGDSPNSLYPNWVTCPWPEDYLRVLEYQWNEVLIPYWKKTVKFANEHGVSKIALEMHPGFCVYNPESLLKLRAAVGETIGANFDPSHLFWQGINPVAAIRKLGPAIYHFHAKDTRIDPINASVNGVLDTKHYSDEIDRSWIFRTVGYGHGYDTWKDIISELKLAGYDGTVSIEHEDGLMSGEEGLKKAISFLKEVMFFEETSKMWWA